MKTGRRRSGTTENPLENEDHRAGCRPWITESAGEPIDGTFLLAIRRSHRISFSDPSPAKKTSAHHFRAWGPPPAGDGPTRLAAGATGWAAPSAAPRDPPTESRLLVGTPCPLWDSVDLRPSSTGLPPCADDLGATLAHATCRGPARMLSMMQKEHNGNVSGAPSNPSSSESQGSSARSGHKGSTSRGAVPQDLRTVGRDSRPGFRQAGRYAISPRRTGLRRWC
jgi:hypothetical protein